jgi:solute:Na+ symporter, SSS family
MKELMTTTTTTLAAENVLRLNLGWLDYVLVAIYFVFVLGIGFIARSQISTSLDFFLSGRRLPAWVTGLAFISANLGAVEIMGMSANGAQVGLSTMHYYWIGAIPAMLFLGVVMMPFYLTGPCVELFVHRSGHLAVGHGVNDLVLQPVPAARRRWSR